MEKENSRFQLLWKGTDMVYYASNSISVILYAYEMFPYKEDLELHIATGF